MFTNSQNVTVVLTYTLAKMPNKLDQIYRSLRLTKYFIKGWGKSENLKRLCEFRKIVSNRETCYKLVSADYPVHIEKEQDGKDCILIDGYFVTPLVKYLPDVIPVACHKAYFQFVLPKNWPSGTFKPVILQIAGTGDQYFWRRRHLIAKPLIKEASIGSIILENPFYGLRKPQEQKRSILHNVSDVFVMGGCLILETIVLFHYCERLGFGPLGVTGLSMGGHMASLAATAWPKPIVVVPCLSGLTASHVFTQGVVSRALNWEMLEKQYLSDQCLKNEVQKMVNIIEDDAFKAGQDFAKNFSSDRNNIDSVFNNSPSDLDEVTRRLQPLDISDTLSSPVESSSSNSVFSIKSTEIPSTNNMSDNYAESNYHDERHSVDITITCDSRSSKNSLSDRSANDANAMHRTCGKSELATTETIVDFLLNSVVRLARASVNLNVLSNIKEIDSKNNEVTAGERVALNFMNGIMDECTHLKNYSVPVDTSLTIAVCADDDAYVPLKGRANLAAVWSGAEVRYVKGGHVRAYVQYQKVFRVAIIDAFERYRTKYIEKSV